MSAGDVRVDLDKVLARAAWLNEMVSEVRANSGATVTGLVAPEGELGRGFGYGTTLLGLPVHQHGDRWGLILTFPEAGGES